jgi:hypothetical protein
MIVSNDPRAAGSLGITVTHVVHSNATARVCNTQLGASNVVNQTMMTLALCGSTSTPKAQNT